MTDKQSLTIANTIAKQIGHGALFMIGAKKKPMYALESGLVMSVSRNPKRINKIKIKLNSMDTYDIEYWYNAICRKTWEDKSKLISSENGIYSDGLRSSIEQNTGLFTKL